MSKSLRWTLSNNVCVKSPANGAREQVRLVSGPLNWIDGQAESILTSHAQLLKRYASEILVLFSLPSPLRDDENQTNLGIPLSEYIMSICFSFSLV